MGHDRAQAAPSAEWDAPCFSSQSSKLLKPHLNADVPWLVDNTEPPDRRRYSPNAMPVVVPVGEAELDFGEFAKGLAAAQLIGDRIPVSLQSAKQFGCVGQCLAIRRGG